jgi:transcriptional regulator with XRE-family HTH domain
MYTAQELIAEMRKIQGDRLAQDFAQELGISHSYLSRIYAGRTDPGELVLKALGLQKRVFYEKVDKVA